VIRFLLWVFVVYIVYKLVGAFLAPNKPRPKSGGPAPGAGKGSSDFSNIEDADFEDLTPKQPPETKEP
jgi:hypothetical protein